MNDDDLEMLRSIELRNEDIQRHHGPGLVVMERCPLCGAVRFKEGRRTDPNSVRIDMMHGPSECGRCAEVHRRNPEVFEWIAGIAEFINEQRVMREMAELRTTPPSDALISSAARDLILLGEDARAIEMIKDELGLIDAQALVKSMNEGKKSTDV